MRLYSHSSEVCFGTTYCRKIRLTWRWCNTIIHDPWQHWSHLVFVFLHFYPCQFSWKRPMSFADVQRIRSRRRGRNEADFLNRNAWYFVRVGRWAWEGTCCHFSTGRNTVGTMGGKSRVRDRGRGGFRAAWYWFQWTNQSRSYEGGLEQNQRGARDASSDRSFGSASFHCWQSTLALTLTHSPAFCIAFVNSGWVDSIKPIAPVVETYPSLQVRVGLILHWAMLAFPALVHQKARPASQRRNNEQSNCPASSR